MAVRNGTAEWTDYLARSSNVPSYDANYTLLCWFRLVTAPGSYSWADLISLRSEPAGVFFFDELGIMNVAGTYNLYIQARNDATRVDALGSTALSTNTWYCAALVRSADTSRIAYLGSLAAPFSQDANLTSGVGSRTSNPAAHLGVAEASSGVVCIGNTKIWTAALTLAELQAEQFKMLPVRWDSLAAWFPFLDIGANRGRDYSGGGDLTTHGTMTDEDNPPVLYGVGPILLPIAAVASGVTVTPTPTTETAGGVDPIVVLGAVAFAPSSAGAVGSGIDPAISLGAITVTPNPADSTESGVDPTVVQGSIVVVPQAVDSISSGVDPTVILSGVIFTPDVALSTSSGVNPGVILGPISITPNPTEEASSGVDPTVVVGFAVTVTPSPTVAQSSSVDPTITLGPITLTPAVAFVVGSGVDSTIILGPITTTPSPAAVIGGTVSPAVIISAIYIYVDLEGEITSIVDLAGDVQTEIDLEGEISTVILLEGGV